MHKVQSLVPSIVPCYNCEETDSNIICLDCIDLVLLEKLSQENNLEGDTNIKSQMHYLSAISYCDNCYSLHRKVKSCRDHSNKLPMKFAGLLQSSLGHICPIKTSDTPSAVYHFFELFENILAMLSVNVNITSFGRIDWLNVLWGMLEQLYDDMMESSYSDLRYWRSVIIMMAICILFNVICKGIFGSATGGVAIVIILVILYVSRDRQKFRNPRVLERSSAFASASIRPPLNKNMNIDVSDTVSVAPSSTGHAVSLEEEEFPGEFWYPLEGKQAHFKPRGRPYAGRAKKRSKDAVSPKEQHYDL
eukprot:gene24059-32473_t